MSRPRRSFHPCIEIIAAAMLLSTAGCQTPPAEGPADSFGLDFSMPPSVDVRGAIVFFIDGVNAEIFNHMLQAGELPAIRKYFVNRGLYCPRAVAGIPSVTLPNETSFVTGLLPGHHGVTGNSWFDRNRMLLRHYATVAQRHMLDGDYTAPTLYEQFPDRPTLSLFYQAHRGATYFDENAISGAAAFVAGFFEFTDRMTLSMFQDVIDSARSTGRFPAVTYCYLLAPDFHAYRFGVDTEKYRDALRHTDRQIGRVLGDVQRAGILDKLVLAIVSDHGHTPTPMHMDLLALLRDKAGLQFPDGGPWESTPEPERQKFFSQATAVAMAGGNRYASIYLRSVIRKEGQPAALGPWLPRPGPEDLQSYPSRFGPPVNFLDLIVRQEAVDAVAYSAGTDRVRIRRKGGEVELRQDGGPGADISATILSGQDPLEWNDLIGPQLNSGAKASPRKWLQAAAGSQFPGLPDAMLAYFRGRRAGDIAVFAAPGWDFKVENLSGHGGLRPADMFVPLIVAGPGVPKGTVDFARSLDIVPTILKLLGKPVPPGLDGIPLPGIGTDSNR